MAIPRTERCVETPAPLYPTVKSTPSFYRKQREDLLQAFRNISDRLRTFEIHFFQGICIEIQ